jgi:hypothetical protein
MTRTPFLSVPVAAVDPDWPERELFPAFDRLRDGAGVVWIPVDDAEEADYILNRLDAFTGSREIRWCEVCHVDPLRFWSLLFGAACAPGRCQDVTARIWLVDGGERLPTASLRDHLGAVRHWARGAGVLLLLPVFRVAFDATLRQDADLVLPIPALVEADVPTRLALAKALVDEGLPLLLPDDRQAIAVRLAQANPSSRSRLATWIGELAGAKEPLKYLRERPAPADEPCRPKDLPTREQLRKRLVGVNGSVRACHNRLQAARPSLHLFFDHHDLVDPFASADPASWFVMLVSHLSSLVLDAGGKILLALAGWTVDRSSGSLLAPDDEPQFPAVLRNLRTTMQHALDRGLKKDREKLAEVREWYRKICGTSDPGSEYARGLADILMRLWETFAGEASKVVEFLCDHPSAPETRPVWSRIDQLAGRLSEEELYDIARPIVESDCPSLSVRDFVRNYRKTINEDLGMMGLQPDKLPEAALPLVKRLIEALANPCPVSSGWLQAELKLKGEAIKDWLFRRQRDWMTADRNVEAFLAETRGLVVAWLEHRDKVGSPQHLP